MKTDVSCILCKIAAKMVRDRWVHCPPHDQHTVHMCEGTERARVRQTERKRKRDRQTYRQTDYRQTDRQIGREKERERA